MKVLLRKSVLVSEASSMHFANLGFAFVTCECVPVPGHAIECRVTNMQRQ